MAVSIIVTLLIYAVSMAFLPEFFGEPPTCPFLKLNADRPQPSDLSFVLSSRFAWKVAVIVAISAFPLYIIKFIRSRVAPAASSKLL